MAEAFGFEFEPALDLGFELADDLRLEFEEALAFVGFAFFFGFSQTSSRNAAELRIEARGADPPLEDRVGVEEAGVGQLVGDHVGVAERVQGVGGVADHQRRVLDVLALLGDRRGPPEQQALEHAAERDGSRRTKSSSMSRK